MNNENEIDDLLENFNLKPITEGLAFHHSLKEQSEVKTNLAGQSKQLKKDLENRISTLVDASKNEKPVYMGELSAFYEPQVDTKINSIQLSEPVATEVLAVKAGMHLRFFAWFIDTIIIFAAMFCAIAMILILSDLPMENLNLFVIQDELLLSFAGIFTMLYMFYFTLLDMTQFSTFGKKLCNIKVVSNKKRTTLTQSFFKTVMMMISIPFVGIPVALGWTDFVSDIRVERK